MIPKINIHRSFLVIHEHVQKSDKFEASSAYTVPDEIEQNGILAYCFSCWSKPGSFLKSIPSYDFLTFELFFSCFGSFAAVNDLQTHYCRAVWSSSVQDVCDVPFQESTNVRLAQFRPELQCCWL